MLIYPDNNNIFGNFTAILLYWEYRYNDSLIDITYCSIGIWLYWGSTIEGRGCRYTFQCLDKFPSLVRLPAVSAKNMSEIIHLKLIAYNYCMRFTISEMITKNYI